jgi:hypothetical protein
VIHSVDIRNHLVSLLSGEESLDAFEDWFVQNSWNVHKQGDPEAERLSYWIELHLAEHSSGHLPEDALMREFNDLLNSVALSIGNSPSGVLIRTGSSASVSQHHVAQLQYAGTSPVVAFG